MHLCIQALQIFNHTDVFNKKIYTKHFHNFSQSKLNSVIESFQQTLIQQGGVGCVEGTSKQVEDSTMYVGVCIYMYGIEYNAHKNCGNKLNG